MDLLRSSTDRFAKWPRGFLTSLQNFWANVQSFDPFNYDWSKTNWAAVLLAVIVGGLILFIAVAQLTEEDRPPGASHINFALGKDSAAVHNPDAPPIPPPTEVVSLRVYPIKSCRGFEIDATRVRKSGLTLDRNWMFIDRATRKFLTIRSDPRMTLIDTTLVDEKEGETSVQMLEISIHDKEDATVRIPAFPSKEWLEANTTLSKVEIWEAETDGYEYGDEVNSMFREFFEQDVSLVYKGPTSRMVAINGAKELYGIDTPHHFADVMSLLVASEASLADLNRRLAEKDSTVDALTIERFRPNIIVRGRTDHPWEEDTWKRIRLTTRLRNQEALYKIDLDVVARCARCQVPNVNPDTADKHPKQPWDELMKFRRVDQGGVAKWKPCFGMMCIPKNEGILRVGAKLEVLETTDKHKYNTARFEDL